MRSQNYIGLELKGFAVFIQALNLKVAKFKSRPRHQIQSLSFLRVADGHQLSNLGVFCC
jgi:hypothetical protein